MKRFKRALSLMLTVILITTSNNILSYASDVEGGQGFWQ